MNNTNVKNRSPKMIEISGRDVRVGDKILDYKWVDGHWSQRDWFPVGGTVYTADVNGISLLRNGPFWHKWSEGEIRVRVERPTGDPTDALRAKFNADKAQLIEQI